MQGGRSRSSSPTRQTGNRSKHATNSDKMSGAGASKQLGSRRKRIVLGVCAMEKKTASKPMREILRRLPAVFEIVVFDERMICEDAVEVWPRCDCLIAFHSRGFPLEKAKAYEALVKPFVLNDLRKQDVLRDRRLVYKTLQAAGVPMPRHVCMSRDWEETGGVPPQTFEEFDDYIIVNGTRMEKPFVEKPVDADDHNIHIYYPMSAGGGSKRLFRKVADKSSSYHAEANLVRRDGSFLYEEFVDTQGTDVKVYAVGPYYGHAEARKSPALDGIVMRGGDGKELRYPVILSWIEKDIAFKVYHAFKQTVCGFDILRTPDGKTLVCDVNGWSFVKKSRKYYDDCAALLSELMQRLHHRGGLGGPLKAYLKAPQHFGHAVAPPPPPPEPEQVPTQSKSQSTPAANAGSMDRATALRLEAAGAAMLDNRHTVGHTTPTRVRLGLKTSIFDESPVLRHHKTVAPPQPPPQPRPEPQRELRSVIAVVRHGDRTPKRKLKVATRDARLCAFHSLHSPFSDKEARIRESNDLRSFAEALRGVVDGTEDGPHRKDLAALCDVLEFHVGVSSNSFSAALFSGIKLQLKPTAWAAKADDGDPAASGDASPAASPPVLQPHLNQRPAAARAAADRTLVFTACAPAAPGDDDDNTASERVPLQVVLVLKWGGMLTELGVQHSTTLGEHFRHSMYPQSADGAGLLRLHATFRHDLKIRTSDEGRVMKTGAAFTKGLLELEGDISPILVSLIHRGRSDVNMLDRAGNHEAQELLSRAKSHVERTFQTDVDLDDATIGLIAPDGPASVISALRSLGNPRTALDQLYDLVDSLVEAVSFADYPPEMSLYMGESCEVWLDSWKDVRKELRRTAKKEKKYKDTKKEPPAPEKADPPAAEAAPGAVYDLSKIPEIFDKVRFDAQHNASRLRLSTVFPRFGDLVQHARLLSRAVTPLEYGASADERRQAAWRISAPLLDKIRFDLRSGRGASGPASGLHFQLDDDPKHLHEHEIKTAWRAVRTRLYFTSESHLHALLTALRLPYKCTTAPPGLAPSAPVANASPVDREGQAWLSQIPELSYLSHLVFRLWEDLAVDETHPERYMVEISFCPGTAFDATAPPPPAPSDGERTPESPASPRKVEAGAAEAGKSKDKSAKPRHCEPRPTSLESPTLPLEQFAYVSSESLESYFDVLPKSTSRAFLDAAADKYDGLASSLEAVAEEQRTRRQCAQQGADVAT
mmetsp:Transcript_9745/g.33689  ORF Transcript_9745/g.33689 Transcript_9745/m.33689 type:complete len:1217 (+) Transcript_9745:54-3704(+)